MDKVLTRKLFKDRYFKLHKPTQFNKGGIARGCGAIMAKKRKKTKKR